MGAVRKHIGVITSGGDAPGMNSAVRAVVRAALAHDVMVTGFYRGYEGILTGESLPLTSRSVGGVISRGGTFLRSARSKEFRTEAGRTRAASILRRAGVEGLVVIGGDGSLSGAKVFEDETGIPCVGVPGSIDNDIAGSDYSIGFDTAVNTAVEAVDKLRDTAYSHERVFVVEVMGRNNGFIALETALAAGAEAVLIPEIAYSLADICEQLTQGAELGKKSCVVIVAEGVGRAADVSLFIERHTGCDVRYLVVGHMQRGGAPTAFDRVLALRLGSFAADRLISGHSAEMVGVEGDDLVAQPIDMAITGTKTIDPGRLALVQRMAK